MSESVLENIVIEFGVGASLAFLGGIIAYLRSLSHAQSTLKETFTARFHDLDTRLGKVERSIELFDEMVMKVITTLVHSPKDPDWPRLKLALENHKENPMSYDDAIQIRGILAAEIARIAEDGGKTEGMYYSMMLYVANKIIDNYERTQH